VASPAVIHAGADQRAYAFGGNAHCTLVSKATGTRYTYHVYRKRDNVFFIDVLSGPDAYTPVGTCTRGRLVMRETKAGSAFAWWLAHPGHPQIEFWHSGKCSKCGRLLTDPASIARGLGPVCATK